MYDGDCRVSGWLGLGGSRTLRPRRQCHTPAERACSQRNEYTHARSKQAGSRQRRAHAHAQREATEKPSYLRLYVRKPAARREKPTVRAPVRMRAEPVQLCHVTVRFTDSCLETRDATRFAGARIKIFFFFLLLELILHARCVYC